MRPALHAFEHATHLPLMFAVALTAAMRDESDTRSEVLDDEIPPAAGALPQSGQDTDESHHAVTPSSLAGQD